MEPKELTTIKLDLTDQELQNILLLGKVEALAEQTLMPYHTWVTQEGLEDLRHKTCTITLKDNTNP